MSGRSIKNRNSNPVTKARYSSVSLYDDASVLAALQEALGNWTRIWCYPSNAPAIRYEVTERLSRSLGRCKQREALIRLNRILLMRQNRQILFETLCHEAAHIAAYYLYGSRAKPHGPEWQFLLKLAGLEPHTAINAGDVVGLNEPSHRDGTLYQYHCPTCGMLHRARFRTSMLRCRGCFDAGRSGVLTVTRVAKG
jgi:predicted SprT family Zn-dependent metalloprotease